MRSMVEGASRRAPRLAPSTALRAVPLPRCAGEDQGDVPAWLASAPPQMNVADELVVLALREGDVGDDLSLVHDQRAAGESAHERHVVLNHDDGDPPGEVEHQLRRPL